MAAARRMLEVVFARAEDFRREFESNLAHGGVFVATDQPFALRESVRVKLLLGFCRRDVELDGEIVHQVTPKLAALGGPCGVAVSFEEPAAEIRKRLGPLVPDAHEPATHDAPAGKVPRAARAPARVAAHIQAGDEPLTGRTRDLSRSGVLVSVPGRGIPVGQRVRIALTHPTSGEARAVDGTVVREVEGESGVSALGIRFDAPEPERPAVERFVDEIRSAEHARRLGGITGDLAAQGVAQLLQRLCDSASAGTVVLRRGAEEALVGFETGILRVVRLGPATGMKALVRLLAWREGSFEFHARLDPIESPDPPLLLASALREATQLHEEGRRADRPSPPPNTVPRLVPAAASSSGVELDKLEQAILDLVGAGFPVRRILDVIPEPDPTILRALEVLVDLGLVQV